MHKKSATNPPPIIIAKFHWLRGRLSLIPKKAMMPYKLSAPGKKANRKTSGSGNITWNNENNHTQRKNNRSKEADSGSRSTKINIATSKQQLSNCAVLQHRTHGPSERSSQ